MKNICSLCAKASFYSFPLILLIISFTDIGSISSVEDLERLSIFSDVFGGRNHALKHMMPEYVLNGASDGSHYSQKDRLASIRELIKATFSIDLPVKLFLESGSLLGIIRDDDLIPWDNDGDVGFLQSECRRFFPVPGSFQKELQIHLDEYNPEKFHVPFLECGCNIDASDCDWVVGRIVDKSTGFYVDMFAYSEIPADSLYDWQQPQDEWYGRVSCLSNFRFPKSSLLPLTTRSVFNNQLTVLVPNKPALFLNYEFGMVLQPPLPWTFLIYTHSCAITITLFIALVILLGAVPTMLALILGISKLAGGLRVGLCAWIICYAAGCIPLTEYRLKRLATIALVLACTTSLMYDCVDLIAQVILQVDEALNISGNNRNLGRLLTICFGSSEYMCVDLEVRNKLKRLNVYMRYVIDSCSAFFVKQTEL